MWKPSSSLVPYLSVIRSGCFFLDVIFTMLPSPRRPWMYTIPLRLAMSRRMYRWDDVTNRWLKTEMLFIYIYKTRYIGLCYTIPLRLAMSRRMYRWDAVTNRWLETEMFIYIYKTRYIGFCYTIPLRLAMSRRMYRWDDVTNRWLKTQNGNDVYLYI